jgi:intein-encoded DNA endonuclease-like protein
VKPGLLGNKNASKYVIDDEELKQLRLEGLSFPKIAQKIGISRTLVKHHMKRLGFHTSIPEHNPFANSKYSFDTGFFSNIDNEKKAYILGLWYADGNNYRKEKYKVSLVLHKNDKCLLEEVNEIISSTRPLQESNNTVVLNISGKIISDQLLILGCIPRKSLILQFPTEEQVPNNLLPHFIRGYFDGDGCITRSRKSQVTMLGTQQFLISLQAFLVEFGIRSSLYSLKNSSIYNLGIYSSGSISLFKNLIYSNSTIKMERKYNKFLLFNP